MTSIEVQVYHADYGLWKALYSIYFIWVFQRVTKKHQNIAKREFQTKQGTLYLQLPHYCALDFFIIGYKPYSQRL